SRGRVPEAPRGQREPCMACWQSVTAATRHVLVLERVADDAPTVRVVFDTLTGCPVPTRLTEPLDTSSGQVENGRVLHPRARAACIRLSCPRGSPALLVASRSSRNYAGCSDSGDCSR